MFEQFLYLQHEATIEEQKKQIRRILPFHSIEILSWDFPQSEPDDPILKLTVVASAKNQIKRIGENILLSPIPMGIPAFDNIESRVFPVRINYPICQTDSIEYIFVTSNDFEVKIPYDIEIITEYGRYSEKYRLKHGNILLIKNFQINKGTYQMNEYPKLYAFIDSVRKAESKSSIILKPK